MSLTQLENKIEQILEDWKVVGGAVSIVKDGETILCRGFGRKRSDRDELADQNTIFGIGSNSKSFTAAAVGLLADDGLLTWDDPIIKFLPDFKMSDPWITSQITLRDVLSHRSGLGRSMRILYNRELNLSDVIGRIRYMPFISPFRDAFGYNNYHFMIAGRVIEVVSGKTWPEFMLHRIFSPLGMHDSSADLNQLQGQKNVSAAHADITPGFLPREARMFSQNQVIPWTDVGNQPAGGINSSVQDLSQWMKMLLNNGVHTGEQFLSPKVIRDMTLPVATFKDPLRSDLGFLAAMQPEINFYSYGLGWFVLDYKGRLMFFHGGQIHGFNSMVVFFPQEKLGFSILTNAHHTLAHAALTFVIADTFLGGSQRDWSSELIGLAKEMVQGAKAGLQQKLDQRMKDTKTSLPLKHYTGVYENNFIGKTTVTLENGELWMRYGTAFFGKLEHWEKDTFHALWEDQTFDPNLVRFQVDGEHIQKIVIEPEGEFLRVQA